LDDDPPILLLLLKKEHSGQKKYYFARNDPFKRLTSPASKPFKAMVN